MISEPSYEKQVTFNDLLTSRRESYERVLASRPLSVSAAETIGLLLMEDAGLFTDSIVAIAEEGSEWRLRAQYNNMRHVRTHFPQFMGDVLATDVPRDGSRPSDRELYVVGKVEGVLEFMDSAIARIDSEAQRTERYKLASALKPSVYEVAAACEGYVAVGSLADNIAKQYPELSCEEAQARARWEIDHSSLFALMLGTGELVVNDRNDSSKHFKIVYDEIGHYSI